MNDVINMNSMMSNILGKIAPGMCRLSIQGSVAVRTSGGYKYYDAAAGRLVNCDNFVFPIGEEFFFVIPTNKVRKGDIILANGKPKYVLESGRDNITALNYDTGVVETIMPERYIFMGNMYLYGKIVSMFGNSGGGSGKLGGKVLRYMMLSQMFKGSSGNGAMSSIMPLLLLSGGIGLDLDFGDMFEDFDNNDDEKGE